MRLFYCVSAVERDAGYDRPLTCSNWVRHEVSGSSEEGEKEARLHKKYQLIIIPPPLAVVVVVGATNESENTINR